MKSLHFIHILFIGVGDSCSLTFGTETGKCKYLFRCDPLWHPIDNKIISRVEAEKLVTKYSVCGEREKYVSSCELSLLKFIIFYNSDLL